MRETFQTIKGQQLTDYLWPNTKTELGRKTAIFEGAAASLALAILYTILSLILIKNGPQIPEAYQEFIDVELYTNIKLLLNLLCILTALYYVRTILKKERLGSVAFLILWIAFEIGSELSNGSPMLALLHSILLLGAVNSYRAVR